MGWAGKGSAGPQGLGSCGKGESGVTRGFRTGLRQAQALGLSLDVEGEEISSFEGVWGVQGWEGLTETPFL